MAQTALEARSQQLQTTFLRWQYYTRSSGSVSSMSIRHGEQLAELLNNAQMEGLGVRVSVTMESLSEDPNDNPLLQSATQVEEGIPTFTANIPTSTGRMEVALVPNQGKLTVQHFEPVGTYSRDEGRTTGIFNSQEITRIALFEPTKS